MEHFVIIVNGFTNYQKALHLGCCSSPRSTSESTKNYKKEDLQLSPKSSESYLLLQSLDLTKNAENDIKYEADIKSNLNYSWASASNISYFSLQDPKLSPDYSKTLTKKTEINAI